MGMEWAAFAVVITALVVLSVFVGRIFAFGLKLLLVVLIAAFIAKHMDLSGSPLCKDNQSDWVQWICTPAQ